MAGRILVDDGGRRFDDNGNPISGAKRRAYIAGTSTPATTYTTRALSVAHPDPLIANSTGEFPQMWADEDLLLDVKDYAASDITYSTPVRSFPNVTPQGPGSQRVVSIMSAGAVGNGSTNDTAAVQAVINANGSDTEYVFPSGKEFVLNSINLTGLSNVTFTGYGSTIKGPAARVSSYLNAGNIQGLTVRGLTFDQMKGDLPEYTSLDYDDLYNVPINADGAEGLVVEDCTFLDLYTTAIFYYQSSGLTIINCVFESDVQTQDQWMQHVHIQTCTGLLTIRDNHFNNAAPANAGDVPAAIYCSGLPATGQIHIKDNRFDYCGRDNAGTHRVGCIDFYGDVTNVFVENNVARNCMAEFIRLNAAKNAIIRGNFVHVNSNAEMSGNTIGVTGSIAFGGQKGIENVIVEDNVFEDESERAAATIHIISYDWGYPSKHITVRGNRFIGCLRPVFITGPFYNVRLESNEARAGRSQIAMVPGTALTGTEANSAYDRLFIIDNVLLDESSDNANAISIPLSNVTTAYVGLFEIRGNSFRANPASSAACLSLVIDSSTPSNTRVNVIGNDIQGYTTAIVAQEMGELMVEDNRSVGHTTFLSTTNVSTTNRRGNRLSAGVSSGRATLAAGTVTVNTAEVVASDNITLTRDVLGGTAGHLSVGTIVAGTSFVINSSEAADTSTIFWQIVH